MKRHKLKKLLMRSNRVSAIILLVIPLICCSGKVVYSAGNHPIVIVKSRSIPPYNKVVISFKETLLNRQKNIDIFEFSFEDEKAAVDLNNRIETIKPTLILTLGTPATKALRQMFDSLTIVYAMILDPTKSNISPPGVSMDIPIEVKLKAFKWIFPAVKTVGTIYSSEYSLLFEEAFSACSNLGLRLIGKKIASQNEFPSALEEVFDKADCFLMITDPNVYLSKTTEHLLISAIQRKIPVIGLSASYAKAGAIIAFDCDYADLGRQTAELVLRMLAGENQGIKETVVAPRRITYSLNLLVAERIDVKLSPEVIKKAEEVFGR